MALPHRLSARAADDIDVRRVLAGDTVNFHPMTNRATLSMHPDDLSAFLGRLGYEPIIVDIA